MNAARTRATRSSGSDATAKGNDEGDDDNDDDDNNNNDDDDDKDDDDNHHSSCTARTSRCWRVRA